MNERLCPVCNRLRPRTHFYPRSGKPRCTHRLSWTQARRYQLLMHIDDGLSNAEIAAKMGVTETAVILARKRYHLPSVMRLTLSGHDVARMMGVGCSKRVTHWIDAGFLVGKRIRQMGPYRGWMVHRSDLYGFIEDERTWHLWDTDHITDPALKRHAEKVRGTVRFLTPGEVAHRLYVQPTTVGQWIRKGWLPARKWGNWKIDERDVAAFELPRIGGRRDAAWAA